MKLLARFSLWCESLRTRWCARKIKPYSALLRGEIAPSVEIVWDEEKYFVQYQARRENLIVASYVQQCVSRS